MESCRCPSGDGGPDGGVAARRERRRAVLEQRAAGGLHGAVADVLHAYAGISLREGIFTAERMRSSG